MGRSLSPLLREQMENLGKDAESRKSAMKYLKSFVEDLDSKAIPVFVAQVSETSEPNPSSRECTISLYEVLARFHGRKIIPHIDNIMSTIVRTLMLSTGSFPLQQACSKVVPTIARYSIEPSTPDYEKPKIIASLCKPLSDLLMVTADCAASGSALCLKALVECENWRYASGETVNEVCLKIAGSLEEKHTQTNCHIDLAMALATRNSLVIEAYARSIVRAGIQMLIAAERNLKQRLAAIRLISHYMKGVDSRSIFSEVKMIIDVMERCQSDPMECVRGAASDALHTAKNLYNDKCSTIENGFSSAACSSIGRRRDSSSRKYLISSEDASDPGGRRSPRHQSPESQTIHSFTGHSSSDDSPLSVETSDNRELITTRRKLWMNEQRGVNVSLKDGFFSEAESCSSAHARHFNDGRCSDGEEDGSHLFSGFNVSGRTDADDSNSTFCPERRHLQLRNSSTRIFTTPRKLIRTLQDLDDASSTFSLEETRRARSPEFDVVAKSPGSERNMEELWADMEDKWMLKDRKCSHQEGMPSVPSTSENYSFSNTCEASGHKENSGIQIAIAHTRNFSTKMLVNYLCVFSLMLPVLIIFSIWRDDKQGDFSLTPT